MDLIIVLLLLTHLPKNVIKKLVKKFLDLDPDTNHHQNCSGRSLATLYFTPHRKAKNLNYNTKVTRYAHTNSTFPTICFILFYRYILWFYS